MYSYSYDVETGGILLNSSPLLFSKEPRPVYYKELEKMVKEKAEGLLLHDEEFKKLFEYIRKTEK